MEINLIRYSNGKNNLENLSIKIFIKLIFTDKIINLNFFKL